MPLKKVRFGSKAKAIYPTHYTYVYGFHNNLDDLHDLIYIGICHCCDDTANSIGQRLKAEV